MKMVNASNRKFPNLAELADLPQGWYAERAKVGEPWMRKKHEDSE